MLKDLWIFFYDEQSWSSNVRQMRISNVFHSNVFSFNYKTAKMRFMDRPLNQYLPLLRFFWLKLNAILMNFKLKNETLFKYNEKISFYFICFFTELLA